MRALLIVPNAKFEALRLEMPDPFDATSNPWIASPVSVPTDVITG